VRPAAALALLAFAAGCRSSQSDLQIVIAGDAGACESVDAGADAGASKSQLHCVNFLRFRVEDGSSFSTYCIKLEPEKRLETLCDLAKVADGRELFKLDPNAKVAISVQGLRVFPTTSCDPDARCPAREIFAGDTGTVRIKDSAGGSIELPVAMTQSCGASEEYFPKPSGSACVSICETAAKVVCDLPGWCLCKKSE
jgi:hypothetical protein